MGTETPEEQFTRLLLEREGHQVSRIPEEPTAKRADFHATLGVETHLIEITTKTLPPFELFADGRLRRYVSLGYSNAISGVVRDGTRQLLATPGSRQTFNVVWFVLVDVDWKAQIKQLHATLYGAVDLVFEFDVTSVKAKPCFAFGLAEFHRCRELDAVVAGTVESARLFLNPGTSRRDAFMATRLWELFSTSRAACDALSDEMRGDAFLADFECDRRDEAAVLRVVRRKYCNEHLVPFRPVLREAGALVAD
jgi:hypothetical protein